MRSVYAVIDLTAIRRNAVALKRFAGVPLIAVVKDDAYGHGAEAVALSLGGIADAFAVATAEEGAALRTAGISENILVLTPPLDREEVSRIIAYDLTAAVGSRRAADLLAGTGASVHLAVNTGMNRYGVRADRAGALCGACLDAGLQVRGMFSHLYSATDGEARGGQVLRFRMAEAAVRAMVPHIVCHLAATDGTLAGVRCDAVRIGLGLYGYSAAQQTVRLRPAMKLYATVAETRRQYGSGAGYQRHIAERELYTLRLGYGQGFFRAGGVGIGKLCMDACVAEGHARAGTRKRVLPDLAAYAAAHGTTVYEVLVRIGSAAEREYIYV